MRIVILCFLLNVSFHASAWSLLGHQVICDVTWHQSTSIVRKSLAAAANRMGYRTFADSCIWADYIRREKKYTGLGVLHYINVDRRAELVQSSPCIKNASGNSKPLCVVTAIPYYHKRLYSHGLNQRQRDEDLLLLANFVGDVHQPMHVSYADDHGGNRRKLIFNGKWLNLHRLWDKEILHCGFKGSWRTLGARLASLPVPSALHQDDVYQWANESLQYTRKIYRQLPKKHLPDNYWEPFFGKQKQNGALSGSCRMKHLQRILVSTQALMYNPRPIC